MLSCSKSHKNDCERVLVLPHLELFILFQKVPFWNNTNYLYIVFIKRSKDQKIKRSKDQKINYSVAINSINALYGFDPAGITSRREFTWVALWFTVNNNLIES